ncbi:short-chain dehydrogenase [Erythrobacter sp. Dej080120_24]|uniref:SDR family oxidoreductase n=1 Tax=Erythrobacter sp. Dej080120_24 TaxID=3024837 RepID=UPI00291C7F21|nr:short-chain dehydrogenase [Erythrobacter sp. Dej080120_24]
MRTVRQLIDMSGRRALITGAAGGLGRAMADSLAELGADLLLVDLDGAATPQLAEDLAVRHGIKATPLACDLEDAAQRVALAEKVLVGGGLSVLVNNAAFVGSSDLSGWAEPFEGQTVETWRRALEVNLTAAFHLSQLLIPALRAGPGGSVVNIASIYGEWGPDWSLYEGTAMANPAAYGTSKGGLIQFTRWLATTVAPEVRVNAISPGGVARGQPDSFVERYTARTPLGRMAVEDDFRGAIAYLASDMSAYVTGQVLAIDGGWGAW